MVLEDLHWAGESGLRALRYIVERTANLPVLFLVTHRDTPRWRSAKGSPPNAAGDGLLDSWSWRAYGTLRFVRIWYESVWA